MPPVLKHRWSVFAIVCGLALHACSPRLAFKPAEDPSVAQITTAAAPQHFAALPASGKVAPQVPGALRAAAMQAFQESADERYDVRFDPQATADARHDIVTDDVITAENPAHNLRMSFSAGGVSITTSNASASALTLAVAGYGSSDRIRPVTPQLWRASGQRVERVFTAGGSAIVEWYVNGPLGLEQGFTLTAPPPDAGRDALVELSIGSWSATVVSSNVIELSDGHGTRLRYRDLIAHDAAGRDLPARMTVQDNRIMLAVETTGARYPVTIDPLVEQQKIASPDGDPGEGFFTLGLDGNTALIGAAFDDIEGRADQGSAYIFVRTAAGWTFLQKLIAIDGEAGDQFGAEGELDGDTALISAQAADSQIDNQGAVYVFVRSGGFFVQAQKLTGDPAVGRFGTSVALDGNDAIVGASDETIDGKPQQGAAYVFTRISNVFTRQQKLVASDGTQGARFGSSVAISGATALVGAPTQPPATSLAGSAYVFTRSGGGALFVQSQKLAPADAPRQAFGVTVRLDGDTAAVSSQLSPVNGKNFQGLIFIFVRSGGLFSERQRLAASDGKAQDQFGASFALDGDTLVAGLAPFGSVEGVAYVFRRVAGSFVEREIVRASDGAAGEFFGLGVEVSGAHVLVAAPLALERRGAVYAFEELAGQNAPAGLTATVSGAIVNLSWTAAAGATTYRLRAGTTPGASNAFDANVGAVTSLVATAPNGTYFVRVHGVGAAGESGPSNEVRVDVGPAACVPVTTPVLQPATVTGSTVRLTWAAVQGATRYIIEAGSASGLANLANFNTGNTSTSFTALNVPRGTYFVRVRAQNACSTSSPSIERIVVVP